MSEERKNDCCCEVKEEVRNFVAEDCRRGEKRVKENSDERVTEVYLEPLKMELFKRIREEKRPVVCHRETETFDANGQVIEKVVEDLNEDQKLRLVDHIAARPQKPTEPEYVTKDEFRGLAAELKGAVEAVGETVQNRMAKKSVVSAQNLLEDNLKNVSKETWVNAILLGLFVIEVGVLGWVVFFM